MRTRLGILSTQKLDLWRWNITRFYLSPLKKIPLGQPWKNRAQGWKKWLGFALGHGGRK